MRSCQICGSNGKRVIHNDYDSQPMCLFECTDCGHRYVDAQDPKIGQAWFDRYYLTRYRTDDKEHSDARLNSLADFIQRINIDAVVSSYRFVLDIGGTDGELKKRLLLRGVSCNTVGIGFSYEYNDCVVLSHVLEHVYDIDAFFDNIGCRLLVVEIPIHLDYVDARDYDYHWQHINKFRPQDVERLISQKGYRVNVSERIEDYREYKVWRLAGIHEGR